MSRFYVGLIVRRGEFNDYFGMDLNNSEQGTVKVSMIKYLGSVLQELPDYLGATTSTPASGHIFRVKMIAKHSTYLSSSHRNFTMQ